MRFGGGDGGKGYVMGEQLGGADVVRADVVFALDDEPGIERHGRHRFRYVDQASGAPVTDEETVTRIRALTIPPVWTDVWIAADPRGHLRRRVQHDLARRGLPEDKVIALVVRLLEETFVRVGNEEYARTNGSYGLTTLRHRHVRVDGSRLRVRFRAKSAKTHDVEIDDPRLVRLVCGDARSCPASSCSNTVDDAGLVRPVHSTDVNDYLRTVTGES